MTYWWRWICIDQW